jgi:hypothetical protein
MRFIEEDSTVTEELMNITILVCLVVMLPIVPAYILYKSLPARTTVSGPFKGLNIQLTGAFGGYFVVVLLVAGFITGHIHMKQKDMGSKYELWTIEGNIRVEGKKMVQGIIFTIKPPRQDMSPNGHFVIERVMLPKELTVRPDLIIQKAGYDTETVNLREDNKKYKIRYVKNKDSKTISIDNEVVLLPKATVYKGDQKPTLVDNSVEAPYDPYFN